MTYSDKTKNSGTISDGLKEIIKSVECIPSTYSSENGEYVGNFLFGILQLIKTTTFKKTKSVMVDATAVEGRHSPLRPNHEISFFFISINDNEKNLSKSYLNIRWRK